MPRTTTRQTPWGLGYRRDTFDPRDHIFGAVHNPTSNVINGHISLRPHMPEVYDQSQIGSCTGNGWAGVMEYMEAVDNDVVSRGTPSRLYIYYHERLLEGTVGQDSGAMIRTGAQVVSSLGVPPETDWPYDIAQFTTAPPQQAETDAAQHKALEYMRIVPGPGAPFRSAIVNGLPVVFGFQVPQAFESLSAEQPYLGYPDGNTQYIGGHCVVGIGFDWTMTRFPVPVVECRNSWGPSWGEAGHFYMDYRWFNNPQLASDFWVVRKVS